MLMPEQNSRIKVFEFGVTGSCSGINGRCIDRIIKEEVMIWVNELLHHSPENGNSSMNSQGISQPI